VQADITNPNEEAENPSFAVYAGSVEAQPCANNFFKTWDHTQKQ
jgi:hypothetical protein